MSRVFHKESLASNTAMIKIGLVSAVDIIAGGNLLLSIGGKVEINWTKAEPLV